MPSLKDTKRRIVSVKSTQKITRAMKLVSAAKFARANTALIQNRPYAARLEELMSQLVAGADIDSPLVASEGAEGQAAEKKALVILLGTDRGLCGSLNTILFKVASRWLDEKRRQGVDVDLWAWGRRSMLFSRKLSVTTTERREKVLEKPNYEFTRETAEQLIELITNGKYDRIYVAYAEFKSALAQVPTIRQLLPILPAASGTKPDFIIEPGLEQLFPSLVRRTLASQLYRVLLEGAASEHGSRMTAMESATNNASEVIRRLTLSYNRARQAAITKELIEIISGAEAL